MMGHLGSKRAREDSAAISAGDIQLFEDWVDVNHEKPVVVDGQHRMAALRMYVEETASPETELWWICMFYDRGKDIMSIETIAHEQ